MLFKIFFYLILTLLIWQGLNVTYIYLKRQFLLLSNEVVDNNGSIWEQCLLLSGNQVGILKNLIQELIYWQLNKTIDKQLQALKDTVLQTVVNHLNQNLSQDLQLKTINPATTGGVDVWVYLAHNLDTNSQKELEEYFMGVLAKYTNEFALDYMHIEMNIGAGWIAKFDVKTIEEATYNRMARQTEIIQEEDF